MPLFTVLLPVTRPPHLLPFAIESVLDQTVRDFELGVVCDGAPPETVSCSEDYARRDPRVKVFVFPKGERHGEAHRHIVLSQSTPRYVAHICDDDLWFPNHLSEMQVLLSEFDFGNLLLASVRRDGSVELTPGDLARPHTRRRMLDEKYNFFGPTHAGYRLDAYRRLTQGWAPAPPDLWTDLHMWRKFLAIDGLKLATRAMVTSLTLAALARRDTTFEQRIAENRAWLARIRVPHEREAIERAAWQSLLETIAARDAQREGDLEHLRLMTASRDEFQHYLELMAESRDEYRRSLELMTVSRDDYRQLLELMTTSRDSLQAERDALRAALTTPDPS